MAYKSGFSNVKDILVDFISTVCFDDDQNYENWQLIYPKTLDKEEARDIILKERRATISTTYIPESKWVNNEVIEVTKEIIDSQAGDLLKFSLKKQINKNGSAELYTKGNSKNIFYINNDLETLGVMEYYIDFKTNELFVLKDSVPIETNEGKIYLIINYQAYSIEEKTWYVDFKYPEFTDDGEKNYQYISWTFGNKINENFHVINEKVNPLEIRCYWHTSDITRPSAEWLSIEYFISWDINSIAFVLCEGVITDLNYVQHAFNYIGVLENIEKAAYDDIENNFGSCGSCDVMTSAPNGVMIDKSAQTVRANVNFKKIFYDSYFNEKAQENLIQFDNVAHCNYKISGDMIEDYNLITNSVLQFETGEDSVEYAHPEPVKSLSPIGTVTGRHNVLNKFKNGYFVIPREMKIIEENDSLSLNKILLQNVKVYLKDKESIVIPNQSTTITVLKDVSVINLSTGINDILYKDTVINIPNNLIFSYKNNEAFSIESGTRVTDSDGNSFQLLEKTPIFSTKVILNSNNLLTLMDKVEVRVPTENSFVTREIEAGTNIRLVVSSIYADFDLIKEYDVSFQYREPYKGDVIYYFANEWFDNSISGEAISGYDSPIVLPIKEEPTAENSKFILNANLKQNLLIEETTGGRTAEYNLVKNISNITGKTSVIDPLIFSRGNNNDFHKVNLNVPKILTNPIGESWYLKNVVPFNSNVSHSFTGDSGNITNIIMYPSQKYSGTFYYKKRTMYKATISVEQAKEMDDNWIKIVAVDNNRKILVDFNDVQTYKNVTFTRKNNKDLYIEVDMENPVDEEIYLTAYKTSSVINSIHYDSKNQYYYAYTKELFLKLKYNYFNKEELINKIYPVSGVRTNSSDISAIDKEKYNYIPTIYNVEPNKDVILGNEVNFLYKINMSNPNETIIPIDVRHHSSFANIWL